MGVGADMVMEQTSASAAKVSLINEYDLKKGSAVHVENGKALDLTL